MKLVAICVNDAASATLAAKLCQQHFPQAKVVVRAVDRAHSMELVRMDVDSQVRETFESAIALGRGALEVLGSSSLEVHDIEKDVRQRDEERFAKQMAEGVHAGGDLLRSSGTQALQTRVE